MKPNSRSKKLKFVGEDDLFINGQSYIYIEIAEKLGCSASLVRSKLLRKKEFTMDIFAKKPRKKREKRIVPFFDTPCQEISAKYLRKKLI